MAFAGGGNEAHCEATPPLQTYVNFAECQTNPMELDTLTMDAGGRIGTASFRAQNSRPRPNAWPAKNLFLAAVRLQICWEVLGWAEVARIEGGTEAAFLI
jgi:hypothetical protein